MNLNTLKIVRETKEEIRINAKKGEKYIDKAQGIRTYILWNVSPRNGKKNSSRPVTSATKYGNFLKGTVPVTKNKSIKTCKYLSSNKISPTVLDPSAEKKLLRSNNRLFRA